MRRSVARRWAVTLGWVLARIGLLLGRASGLSLVSLRGSAKRIVAGRVEGVGSRGGLGHRSGRQLVEHREVLGASHGGRRTSGGNHWGRDWSDGLGDLDEGHGHGRRRVEPAELLLLLGRRRAEGVEALLLLRRRLRTESIKSSVLRRSLLLSLLLLLLLRSVAGERIESGVGVALRGRGAEGIEVTGRRRRGGSASTEGVVVAGLRSLILLLLLLLNGCGLGGPWIVCDGLVQTQKIQTGRLRRGEVTAMGRGGGLNRETSCGGASTGITSSDRL
jgi:hypothetical protein